MARPPCETRGLSGSTRGLSGSSIRPPPPPIGSYIGKNKPYFNFSLHLSLTIVKKVNEQYFLNLSYVTVNEKTTVNEVLQ